MLIRYGTDIVKIERIRRLLLRRKAAAGRLFTADEREYAQSRGAGMYATYAAMFAAKEAAVKALRGGVRTWQEIEVGHDAVGAPCLRFSGAARARASELGLLSSTLSLSHEREYAIAGVILWGKETVL